MIIDFHTHCFPDEIAGKAVAALSACARIPPKVNGTVSGIKESMKLNNVTHSIVLSIATRPSQTEKINTWSAGIQKDGIIAFGSVHPDYDNWKSELQRIKELGLKGIKFHPDYQNFYVDDAKIYPIYERAFELGLIIVFHAGVDIGLLPPYHCMPDRLSNMIRSFKGGKVVAAHMGGYNCWDEVEKYLVGSEVYFDTSYSLGIMDSEQARRIIYNHGYDKILFGTDSPWCDQGEEIQKIKELKLTKEAENAILFQNSAELLGLS